MARYIITLQALGKELAWMLLQQARGIPEAKFKDDFLDEKTFVLLFARPDLSERLCITAAIRQMSGHTGSADNHAKAVLTGGAGELCSLGRCTVSAHDVSLVGNAIQGKLLTGTLHHGPI